MAADDMRTFYDPEKNIKIKSTPQERSQIADAALKTLLKTAFDPNLLAEIAKDAH